MKKTDVLAIVKVAAGVMLAGAIIGQIRNTQIGNVIHTGFDS